MKKRDLQRITDDDRIDELLSTCKGQREYWKELKRQCEQSSLIALLEDALLLEGDIVECGVFRGRSVKKICRTVKEIAPEKIIYACDSFEGFPENGIQSVDTTFFRRKSKLQRKFSVAQDCLPRLKRFATTYDVQLKIVSGYFENTLRTLPSEKFCFVHIDCDSYQSHMECLNTLYDKLVPGGLTVYDDYHERKWPGATKAIDEFLSNKVENPMLSQARRSPAWCSIKPR